MAEANKEMEIQDDGTEYQDMEDEPTAPMVSTPLTRTEARSEDEEWRLPMPRPIVRPLSSASAVHRGAGKPQIKPQRYDGRGSWTQYLQHFKRVSVVNEWSQAHRHNFLMVLLDKEALSYAEGLPEEKKEDFNELVLAMEERFGDKMLTEVFKSELKSRTRKDQEALPSLGQAIRDLVWKAYPRLDWDAKEDLAVDYFIQAIPNREIRLHLHQRQPRNTMEAVKVAVDLEAWMIAEDKEQGRRVRSVRPMTIPTREEREEQATVMQEIRDMIKALGERKDQPVRRSSGPWKCFVCDSPDHLARQCPQKKKKASEN